MNEKLNAAMTAYAASPTEANRAAIAKAVAPELLDEIATLTACLLKREQSLIDAKKRELADPLGGIEILEHPTLKRAAFANDLSYNLYMAERASREQPAADVSAPGPYMESDPYKRIFGISSTVAVSAPTDLSKRLRKLYSDRGNELTLILPADILAAANEIERYYGGMMAWKQTAEKKDADWQAERMGRVDDRIAARAAAPVCKACNGVGSGDGTVKGYDDGDCIPCDGSGRAAAPSVSAPTDERAEFEAWAANNGMHDLICEGSGPDRQYLRDGPYMCWKTWQAARAAAPVSGPQPAGIVVTYNEGGSGEHKSIEPTGKAGYSLAESLPAGTLIYTAAPVSGPTDA